MGVSSAAVLYLVVFSSVVKIMSVSQHHMRETSGLYCQEHILKQFASSSRRHLQCAIMCAEEKMCVAFSRHDQQCFLHSSFCNVNSLTSAEGSSYSDVSSYTKKHISEVEWEYYKSSRYYMPALKTSKTRGDAKAFCESLGGHLVALETPDENDYIINLVFQTSHTPNSDEVHMDLVNDGTWEHSGEQLNFKGGWMDGQPNNWTGPQDCATLFADGWNDRSCNFNIPFLCEINIEN